MDMSQVKFIESSEDIINNAVPYWTQALDIARRTTIARVKKCCQIMGRLENKLTAAQILYPLMQCTDIFFLKADICQLGVDQRKVNMLAREYCDSAGIKNKPIILSHHMLYGLKKGQEKMSKSDPDSAIFMEDTVEVIYPCTKYQRACFLATDTTHAGCDA
jgi:tyrosyl-tRNA synthetase